MQDHFHNFLGGSGGRYDHDRIRFQFAIDQVRFVVVGRLLFELSLAAAADRSKLVDQLIYIFGMEDSVLFVLPI